jgi:hypothetical protein
LPGFRDPAGEIQARCAEKLQRPVRAERPARGCLVRRGFRFESGIHEVALEQQGSVPAEHRRLSGFREAGIFRCRPVDRVTERVQVVLVREVSERKVVESQIHVVDVPDPERAGERNDGFAMPAKSPLIEVFPDFRFEPGTHGYPDQAHCCVPRNEPAHQPFLRLPGHAGLELFGGPLFPDAVPGAHLPDARRNLRKVHVFFRDAGGAASPRPLDRPLSPFPFHRGFRRGGRSLDGLGDFHDALFHGRNELRLEYEDAERQQLTHERVPGKRTPFVLAVLGNHLRPNFDHHPAAWLVAEIGYCEPFQFPRSKSAAAQEGIRRMPVLDADMAVAEHDVAVAVCQRLDDELLAQGQRSRV